MSRLLFSDSLRDQILADLNWLRSNSSLLESGLNLDVSRFSIPASFDLTPVETFLSGNCSHRVGYYFEALVQILLESNDAISDVRHGIQIRENGETLGEIDFLYRCRGVLNHLEVALKFFLYSPDFELHGSRLLGPNARDTFERKRDRLLQKQIPLGRERFSEVRESHLLMKGMIFYPWLASDSFQAVTGLSSSHLRGIWIRDEQLADFLSELPPDSCGEILKKPFWLSGRAGPEREFRSPSALSEEIPRIREDSWQAVFFRVGVPENDRLRETQRVFVIRDDWPFDS